MSNMPLVLFQLYAEDSTGFNALRGACDVIENIVLSRFVGRVSVYVIVIVIWPY